MGKKKQVAPKNTSKKITVKKKGAQKKRPSKEETQKPSWPTDLHGHNTDEFNRLVAELAWRDGLTANAIARELGLSTAPSDLMRVKRALKKSHGEYFKLIPSICEELQDSLKQIVKEKPKFDTEFVVVNDSSGLGGVVVPAKAAEVLAEMISQVALTNDRVDDLKNQDPTKLPQLIVSNTGGRTISLVVKALQQSPPVLDQSDEAAEFARQRLLFLGANAAFVHDEFHQSANFLAVTMAQIFGAGHMALPNIDREDIRKRHAKLIENTSIFLCGAGTLDPPQDNSQPDGRALIVRYLEDKGEKLPPAAIGDLAFNLIDIEGRPVDLDGAAREVINRINPTADLWRLRQIRQKAKILLVLDSAKPEAKRKVGTAIILGGYATHVVLGSRLAKLILEDLENL